MVKNIPANAGDAKDMGFRHGFDPWVGKIPRRKERQFTPVILFGKFGGQRSLVAYGPWGHKELDMTEQLTHTLNHLKLVS